MKSLKFCMLVLSAAVFFLFATHNRAVQGQSSATEAPTGFDTLTNGMVDQSTHDSNRMEFEAREEIDEGLGPVYNAQSCAECHQSPVTGAISQVTVLRAGKVDFSGRFTDPPGGSLIGDRATDPAIQEHVPNDANVRTFRTSLNTLGDGFIEAIADSTIMNLANNQPNQSFGIIAGQVIQVPLLEAPGKTRVARFGWKNQHASLLSFSADAYLNEMGITSPLLPNEVTSMGMVLSGTPYDTVADPEDNGEGPEKFANFMRSSKAPPRDTTLAATPDAQAGAQIFNQIGCAICHVPTIITAPPGTVINGGTFTVPPALGNKIIHPYSDFLLHNVGTGDGIVQNGGPTTRNKLRTPPLWGVRTRPRLLHDGTAFNFNDAIVRHSGEALFVKSNYLFLNPTQRNQLMAFLKSL